MKNLSFTSRPPAVAPVFASTESMPLCPLIKDLMKSFIPLAVEKSSFIVNDVDPAFQLCADQQTLAFVLSNLLDNAISTTSSVCIRVEAVKQAEGIQIGVRISAANFYSTVTGDFSQVLAAAYRLGGNIHIYNQRNQGMVISLSLAASSIS
ncbi:HAMP domain-containing histidine kinase [Pseudoflavitalea sp. X16]|uniref:HAMP domain-containing histidine kinase n=1 Tax=Paraflavitalea devenefica TaxID=2716334 RepID=UPI00141E6DEC|nr:HAMP domain-containing histidine kinase [Paraflavitalea devenefica]NII27065.1 HAMP domain-containing histidine kinase [Paraflavitalea devenefica]